MVIFIVALAEIIHGNWSYALQPLRKKKRQKVTDSIVLMTTIFNDQTPYVFSKGFIIQVI